MIKEDEIFYNKDIKSSKFVSKLLILCSVIAIALVIVIKALINGLIYISLS